MSGDPEVVLEMPGLDDPASHQAMEVRGPKLDPASGAGNTEKLTGVDATGDGTHRHHVPGDHDVTILYDEPLMLLVPSGHRLAGKESVTLDDIADEPIPRFPDPAWNAYWRVDPRPGGSPAPDGPLVETIEDKLEAIAAGQAVAISPAALHAVGLRSDLTAMPLEGVDRGHVVLATRAADRGPLVAAFRKSAQDCLTGAA